VQRWLKFVTYLPQFDIQPIVYIPENPNYPIEDFQMLKEVPKGVIVLKKKIIEPYNWVGIFSKKTKKISSGIIPSQKEQTFFQRMAIWVRGNLFIPDARFLWIKPSVYYLSKYIQENNIECIITSGPPHSLHLIGLQLKQKLTIQWITDFRDPWTTIGYHNAFNLSAYAQRKHKKLEKLVLTTADHIIVTSKTTKKEFEVITPKPISVITNGFDNEPHKGFTLDEKFSLAHIGSFLSKRNPQILWHVLSELIIEIPSFKNDLQLKLIGTTSQEVIDSIKQYNLSDFTINKGYLSHEEAIKEQCKAQILLLIEIDAPETKCILPGKLFEYLISGRPIIGIGPKDSDFEEIILETQTGIFVNYSEKEKLKAQILDHYHQFLKATLKTNPINLEHYSRKNLTKALAKIILP
jgi:hypothetical protein